MKTLTDPPENATAEGTISPATARQAAMLFLAEGATPAWMRDAARESGLPAMIATVADAVDALIAEGITAAGFLAVLEPEAAR